MALLTNFLKLFKWNTEDENDLEQQFDIDKAMNDNWDKLDEAIKGLDTNKVDKVNGKGLSTNDYTNEDKAKLDSLENYDDTEIKQDIEDIQTKDEAQDTEIDKQSDLIQKLKDNCINVTTEEAISLHVEDASALPARLEVRGNQRQATREGYSLWDYLNVLKASAGGLTIEKDYENGYITVNGTPNANYIYISSSIIITDMLEDGQRYTLWQEVYASEGITDGIYMQVTRTADNEENIKYYSRNNLATFKVDKSNNATYSITLQTSTIDGTGTLTNYKNRYMLYKGTDEKTYELPGASPSINYPSEIKAVGDNVNILPNNAVSTSHNGVNYTINEDGSIYAVGTATSNSQVILAGQMSSTEEIMKLRKGVQYKNVGNVDIIYRDTNLDYARLQEGNILTVDENVSVGCFYLQVNSGTTVDETYYPKLVEYCEEMDESYSKYGQGSVEIKKINSNIMPIQTEKYWEYTENGIKNKANSVGKTITEFTIKKGQTIKIGFIAFTKPSENTTFTCQINDMENLSLNIARFNNLNLNQKYEFSYTAMEDVVFKYVLNGNSANEIFEFQLWANIEILEDYQRYDETDYVLPIQQPMLSGDYFVKETDGWKEVHAFGYVNTREVENLGVSLNTSNGEFRRYNAYNLVTDRKSGEYLKILCTHFKRTDSRWHENEGICGWETGQSFCIGTFNTNYDTVDRMKTFLQNNDVGIYYELATPTKLACTEEQSAILDQLSELELFKGTNNIITAESLALMQMQYIADTETYIDNRIDEKLANINQQILEIAGGN